MAIRDLLWACPLCSARSAIRPAWRGERCSECGARFRRVAGSTIEAVHPRHGRTRAPAPEWLDRLGPAPPVGAGEGESAALRGAVQARFAEDAVPIRSRGEFLGLRERLGAPSPGELVLEPDRLRFRPEDGEGRSWPLLEIAGIQSSSSTVQVKIRRGALVSFRFVDTSPKLWEESIQATLRRLYREGGLGEIREFQPRICVR